MVVHTFPLNSSADTHTSTPLPEVVISSCTLDIFGAANTIELAVINHLRRWWFHCLFSQNVEQIPQFLLLLTHSPGPLKRYPARREQQLWPDLSSVHCGLETGLIGMCILGHTSEFKLLLLHKVKLKSLTVNCRLADRYTCNSPMKSERSARLVKTSVRRSGSHTAMCYQLVSNSDSTVCSCNTMAHYLEPSD